MRSISLLGRICIGTLRRSGGGDLTDSARCELEETTEEEVV